MKRETKRIAIAKPGRAANLSTPTDRLARFFETMLPSIWLTAGKDRHFMDG